MSHNGTRFGDNRKCKTRPCEFNFQKNLLDMEDEIPYMSFENGLDKG